MDFFEVTVGFLCFNFIFFIYFYSPISGGIKRSRHSMNLSHLDLAANLNIIPNQLSLSNKITSQSCENFYSFPRGEKESEVKIRMENREINSMDYTDNCLNIHNDRNIEVNEDSDNHNNHLKRLRSRTKDNIKISSDDLHSTATGTATSGLNNEDISINRTLSLTNLHPLSELSISSSSSSSVLSIIPILPSSTSSTISASYPSRNIPRIQSEPLLKNKYISSSTIMNVSTKVLSSPYNNWNTLNDALQDIETNQYQSLTNTVNPTHQNSIFTVHGIDDHDDHISHHQPTASPKHQEILLSLLSTIPSKLSSVEMKKSSSISHLPSSKTTTSTLVTP